MRVVNPKVPRILSIFAVLTLPVPVVDGDWPAVAILVAAAVIGWIPGALTPERPRHDSTQMAMAEVAVSWVQVTVGAAVVTVAMAQFAPGNSSLADPVSALFEATSGVSTTGLTMVSDPATLTPTMQWWRSIMQWGGAAGVVAFALFVAETSGDRDEQLQTEWGDQPAGDTVRSVRIIVALLIGLTIVAFLGLWTLGDPPWTAANHALTAAATGGFSIVSESAAASPPGARIWLAFIALVSAVSYATIWTTVTRSGPPLWKRTQIRWTLMLMAVFGGAVVLAADDAVPLGDALFNAASASATAGFSTGDSFKTIPAIAVITIVSMFVGGAAGSTAGGVKVARIVWIAKASRRWLPQGGDVYRTPFIWDGEEVDAAEAAERVTGAGTLIAVWAVTAVVAAFALAATTGAEAVDAVFESISALSGVGLSRGVTSADLAAGPKLLLSAIMLVGRVEVTAFIALALHATRRLH